MALTQEQEEFIAKLHSINILNKQIEAINLDRQQKEADLSTEYKVNECNTKRALLVSNAKAQIDPLQVQIKVLKDSI